MSTHWSLNPVPSHCQVSFIYDTFRQGAIPPWVPAPGLTPLPTSLSPRDPGRLSQPLNPAVSPGAQVVKPHGVMGAQETHLQKRPSHRHSELDPLLKSTWGRAHQTPVPPTFPGEASKRMRIPLGLGFCLSGSVKLRVDSLQLGGRHRIERARLRTVGWRAGCKRCQWGIHVLPRVPHASPAPVAGQLPSFGTPPSPPNPLSQ